MGGLEAINKMIGGLGRDGPRRARAGLATVVVGWHAVAPTTDPDRDSGAVGRPARGGAADADGDGDRIEFGAGLPDLDLVPLDDLRRSFDAVFEEGGRATLGYYRAGGPSEMRYGCLELRRSVARFLARRDGRDVGPEGVVLVHGSTDGLANAVDAFSGPGTGAVVEETTFHHVPRFLARSGATVRRAPLDASGVDVDAVDAALGDLARSGAPPGLVYTIASFHSPTGTVLPLDRRLRLIEVARSHGAVVVEDACYHDLFFDAPPPRSLLGLDTDGVVLQSGTFSKLLAPGLRLGWLAGTPELAARVAGARRDFSVDRVSALAVARYCDAGLLEPHVARLRAAYRAKRDVAVAALDRHCGPWVSYDVPAGGFYLWLRLAPGIDARALCARAETHGLGLLSGQTFGGDAYLLHAVRLSVAQVPIERIEPGIARLGRLLAEVAGS